LRGFCDSALRLGATDAKIIRSDQVEVRNWVRWKCRYGCSHYGRSLMCPPYVPTIQDMQNLLKEYSYALLFRCKTDDSGTLAIELERRVFLKGYHTALAFSSGSCHLCDKCEVKRG